MVFFGKLGMVVAYYFMASIIDQVFMMVFGNEFVSFIFTMLCICGASCAVRCAKIHGKEITKAQRDYFRSGFKNKFRYVWKQKDIAIALILGFIVCLVFTAIPRLATGSCYMFFHLYSAPYIMAIIFPLFAGADFLVWIWAYYTAFRTKKVY